MRYQFAIEECIEKTWRKEGIGANDSVAEKQLDGVSTAESVKSEFEQLLSETLSAKYEQGDIVSGTLYELKETVYW